MKSETIILRSGYDKEKCLVHARCCYAPWGGVATTQPLNVKGSDVFSSILMSRCDGKGGAWSDFELQKGFEIKEGDYTHVGHDFTPIYHKKTDSILILGAVSSYLPTSLYPEKAKPGIPYGILKENSKSFETMKILNPPSEFDVFCSGSCQSLELENGNLLIPVYIGESDNDILSSAVIECSFDGEELNFLRMGNILSMPTGRGLCEPSIIFHKDTYYLTLRNDAHGYVAKSTDGLHYTDPQIWCWDDGEILPNYNTQQHWMTLGDKLYLVYTRSGANNDHVFRHRAPLFAAEVEDMRVKRDTEFIVIKERGARLGNFGVTNVSKTKAVIMAAEWMQPAGCEQYGSDNSIYHVTLSCDK